MEETVNRIVLAGVAVAILSLIIGLLGKLLGHHIIFANATWHNFAQTCLLFSIAYGIGKLVGEKEKSSV
jgi:fucose permease